MVDPLMIEKEEEMTMTMQMWPLQIPMTHHPMQMRSDRPEREQHRQKVMMRIEVLNRPAEVQAARCRRLPFQG
jgi:hypothetical protein